MLCVVEEALFGAFLAFTRLPPCLDGVRQWVWRRFLPHFERMFQGRAPIPGMVTDPAAALLSPVALIRQWGQTFAASGFTRASAMAATG
ncbi:hypothetical protein MRX96_042144 [Rhipicephalus microplus]